MSDTIPDCAPGPRPPRIFNPDDSTCEDAGMTPRDQASVTVQDVIDWFVTRYESTSEAALAEVRRILFLFAAAFGDRLISQMIGDDLVAFVASQKKVKKKNTIGRWLRTLKHPFNHAADLGLILKSPFRGVKLPRGDRGRDLTDLEFRALLRHCTPPFRRVLVFCRYSGARPGELRAAKWSMVRWEAACPMIVLREHKTAHATGEARNLYLSAPVVKLLLFLKRNSQSDYIFTNSFGGPWKNRALTKRLEAARDKAGFGPDVKLYGTRHAFATGSILNKIDVATVQELMGHRSIVTTQRYIHMAGQHEHLANAVNRAVRKGKVTHE